MTAPAEPRSKLTVAIYARYSTDRQDARSIDDQLRRCEAFARDRGYRVVAVFKDAAESGAHLERADMQRLLTATRGPQPRQFRAVIVDDLSRLSRDLGDTWQIVFGDLASAGVTVIDVNTGMGSDGAGARLTFGAMALVNDTFLQLVRTETHRGLEGRALSGFWTGGRVYGYVTVVEPAPPDPEHPRAVMTIDPVEAEVVRRIFRQYAEGQGFAKIAAGLNAAQLRAPYDSDYSKKAGKGWAAGTIRALLLNERYVGTFIWNKRKWIRSPGKRTRCSVLRPPEEWVVRECPELALVSKELWAEVRARFEARARVPRGRMNGEGKIPHLLSGLLRCGTCGSTMSVTSAKVKAGRRYANFSCSAHNRKGKEICPNGLSVSEKKVVDAIFGTLAELLAAPEFAERFTEQFARRVAQRGKEAPATEAAALEAEVRVHEARVQNLTRAVASAGWSDALGEQLRVDEEKLRALRGRLASCASSRERAQVAPQLEAVRAYFADLAGTLERAPERGRLALARLLTPVVLTPRQQGAQRFYEATGALKNLALREEGRVFVRTGCGGRI